MPEVTWPVGHKKWNLSVLNSPLGNTPFKGIPCFPPKAHLFTVAKT